MCLLHLIFGHIVSGSLQATNFASKLCSIISGRLISLLGLGLIHIYKFAK